MENYNGGGFYRLPLCTHLLQQSLRSFCTDSQWLYAVFWRILPRNFPPPKWEIGGYLDRTKANKRNWILVWEDGYCDFARATASAGLQPDLFFKMSHEVYNYGEGLMGKVSAENGHKWIHKDPSQAENTPSWQNAIDPQPRTWEPQFKAGIQTIAVIAVREGLVQLASTHKIQEDLNFIALLQSKFNSLLITHSASSPSSPLVAGRESNKSETGHHDQALGVQRILERQMSWNGSMVVNPACQASKGTATNNHATIMPSMTSLQALLSKLPSVTSPPSTQINHITVSNNSNHNANPSFPYHLSPLIRSLSAPQGDFWLQEPSHTSPITANVRALDPHHCHPAPQPNLGQTFMALNSNVNPDEDYTFMGDLMSG